MNDSIKLAKVWLELENIKNKLDNEVIPMSGYLGLEAPDLMIAMEELSNKIGNHFEKFRLTAEAIKIKKLSQPAN